MLIVPTAVLGLVHGNPGWLRIERLFMLLSFVVALVGSILNPAHLIMAMITRSIEISGVQLLTFILRVRVTTSCVLEI